MKNKFLIAAAEIIGFTLLALFLVYKLYILPRMAEAYDGVPVESGLLIFVCVYLIGIIAIGFHIYRSMIKPAGRAQEELKKAAEESRKAEVIRKEFVANVSHELKTPLTSISGFIETLQQGAAEDPEIRTKFIDIIAIETSRLKRLIEDLLVLSDIENRKESADTKEFCVRDVLEKTVEALEPIAEDKDVRLIADYDEEARIYGSPDRFRQMMVNLIENAIKYSEQGGRVWVTAGITDGKTQVIVRDEGIGIAEEHLERLFERFYRVDKSRSTKAGGTGLGLSIVKHIAALFGADLKVESKAGEGSVFYVTFER
ncbi:ATP-binding protein [Anaerovorax odorimutans]|uniref:histidine kinase n=1 Tax=Anaerovorax odorimutans TaxID=109327 RepID=A0ABT1RMX9_9FIRM|nr:ATP-binding protein [Anaerovorax odorimutans]MCQ4636281.1 ATP-binding protein [Anaerovorax odorimutans]